MGLPSAVMKTLFVLVLCSAVLTVFAEEDEIIEDESIEELKDEDEVPLDRVARAIIADKSLRWTKGIIPFMYHSSVNDDARKEIKRGISTFERFTCLRFVPWTTDTSKKYGLGHNGFLKFYKEHNCNAALGNRRNMNGQYISCCDGTKCMHELGHAIGFVHEHQSPERDGWIRMNNENIQPDQLQWFLPFPADEVVTDGFDIQSVMMYPPGAKRIDGKGDSYNYLWPELHYGKNFFYLFKQIASAYKCADNCQDFKLKCVNDGFLTHVDGKCACLCPLGLDPTTGCKEILKAPPAGTDFPRGTWALPETTSGCPAEGFTEGFEKHNTDIDGPNLKSAEYNLKGAITENSAEHFFCINNGNVGNKQVYWQDGNYCIYPVGGECPPTRPRDVEGADFGFGVIDFFDLIDEKHQNNYSENLPTGVFNKEQTGFVYCCRDSGFLNIPMFLPNKKPLALFTPQYTFGCQEIFGMHSNEEWVAMNSMNYQEATYLGDTPFMQSTKGMRRMAIKHCYYTPAKTDCGAVIKLDDDIPTAEFSVTKEDQVDCTWLITAPEGTKIKLDLVDMNIRGTMPDKCVDYVSVRAVRLGQNGLHYCGTSVGHSIISHYNSMMINFATFKDSTSVFTAKLSLIKEDELCYNVADKGASYAGTVSFTRNFVPCVPWSKVLHCPHHAAKTADLGKNLFSNYCRNPGNGHQPWCYTDADGCKRDYCDVCQIGTRFGNPAVPAVPKPKSVKSVTCGAPPKMFDGKLVGAAKAAYKVGEKVTFQCTRLKKAKLSKVDVTCLSDGKWSEARYSCRRCDPGWTEHYTICYKYVDIKLDRTGARNYCKNKMGKAKLAMSKTATKNTFLITLPPSGTKTYLGGKSPGNTKNWLWPDLKKISGFTPWKAGYPSYFMFPEQCLVLNSDGKWEDNVCLDKYPFICQKRKYKQNFCRNFLSDKTCNTLFASIPKFCKHQDFAIKTCMKKCGKCK